MGYKLSIKKSVGIIMLTIIFLGQVMATPAPAFLGFGGVGIKDEKEMGRKFDVMVRSRLPLVEDPEVANYVKDIVARLSKVMPPQPFTFTSGVVLSNIMNAFAVPGGYVFVFTGLMMNLDSEAELAGVMAHEMAHVTQRHVASRIERGQYLSVASLLLAIAGIAAGGVGGAALASGALGAGQSAMLNYSRIDENEADHIGYQYMVAAGYSPMGMVGSFQKLRQKSWMSGSEIPTYLSSHPDIGDRINGIIARIKSSPKSVGNRKEDNRRFLRVKTLLWARYGDSDAAMQRFASAPKNDCLALMGKGMVLSRRNKVAEANDAFNQAVACGGNDPLVLREAGYFQYRKGDTGRANTLLTQALAKDPRDYMACFYYARLLDETGRLPEAYKYYEEVLRYVPEDEEVHTTYGRALGKGGKNFMAFLHMAYGAMYANDKKKVEQYRKQAESQQKTPEDKVKMDRFTARYKERQEVWKQ